MGCRRGGSCKKNTSSIEVKRIHPLTAPMRFGPASYASLPSPKFASDCSASAEQILYHWQTSHTRERCLKCFGLVEYNH